MAMKITVSFKESEKWIYDKLCDSSSSPATYLKDLAIKHFKEKPRQKQVVSYDDSFEL